MTSSPQIGKEQIELLERLSNACAVSGDEGEVRSIVLEQVKPYAGEVKVDAMGNVLVTRWAASQHAPRVMLAAHMDEVGFMLVEKEEGGLFSFQKVGGIDERQLAGKPVWVGKKHIPGVIGARPIHLTDRDERSKKIPLESLRIDLGPNGGEGVKPGDWATFATTFQSMDPSLRGKALDNRLGVATLIELVRHAPENVELLAAFTVQEEIGLRGARVAAYALNPDLALVIDSTPANDLPAWDDSENTRYNTRLGGGPAIYLADSATLSDPRLISWLVQTAESAGIPYQFRQPGGGGTDAGAIHRQRMGIPSISVSVPGRYAHTASMMARLSDWQNTLALLHRALSDFRPEVLQRA
ncbi:MAG: M42 family metallopeptidase [Chloroflexi bacterium]|nr:M42 family metallopeptidase [Chloroflexota bacterium]